MNNPDEVQTLHATSLKLDYAGALHYAAVAGMGHPGKKKYFARFVRAGQVKGANGMPTGIMVDPEALSKAGASGMFDNKAVFLDHAGFFDYPSLSRLVGTTQASSYNAPDQSIQGEIRLFETPMGEVAEKVISELLDSPNRAPDIGLSIVFYPQWNKERDTITAINHVESVDLVFQPAADGRIIQALSTQYQQFRKELEAMPLTTDLEPEQNHPVINEWIEATAQAASSQVLAASGLPQASKDRLALGKYDQPEKLNAAIEAEREYLARLNQDQVIKIGGEAPRARLSGMSTNLDQIEKALDAMLAGVRPADGIPPLSGIRELYMLLSGDYEMSGLFHADRVQFGNVNSGTMASLVANALNKIVMAEFQEYPKWWAPIASEVDFQSLNAVRWSVLGGVGELPTVAEGAAYTELTWDDKYESSTFYKKGGYLGLTMEAIDKDDTGRLRGAPRALAQAAWLTLNKSVSYIFTQSSGVGPTLVDTYALFESAHHANLGTTALSLAQFTAIRLAMRKQTELNSGERLGALVVPKYILVPPDLEITACQILATDYDYTYALSNGQAAPVNVHSQGPDLQARMAFARSRVIVVDLWTDTNDYCCVADPMLYPSIGIGYRYGRNPEIFSVASPTAGLMFSNDTLPIKVRFVYATGPIDYRGMYKCNV